MLEFYKSAKHFYYQLSFATVFDMIQLKSVSLIFFDVQTPFHLFPHALFHPLFSPSLFGRITLEGRK